MVTVPGERMASRVATSLLNAAGLGELVTSSLKEYEDLAVDLGNNIDKLHSVREKLDKQRMTCPLFDTLRWTRNLESAVKMIWGRHEMGLAPADIDVPDVKGGPDSVLEPIQIIAKGIDGPVEVGDGQAVTGTSSGSGTTGTATGGDPLFAARGSADADSAGGPATVH